MQNQVSSPANMFAFLPISNVGICEVELTQAEASKVLALYPYKQLAEVPDVARENKCW